MERLFSLLVGTILLSIIGFYKSKKRLIDDMRDEKHAHAISGLVELDSLEIK